MAERLGMVIDMKGCVACASCAVACKVENNLPDGVWWNRILTDGGDNPDTPAGAYPNLTMENIAVACQHCENPACVKVCPVGATYKDPETGAVRQDYDKCIGCRMCMSACPYTGVRSLTGKSRSMRSAMLWAMRRGDASEARGGEVYDVLASAGEGFAAGLRGGMSRTGALLRRFNDPESEVSRLLRERAHKQLLPERGTNPSVYYLV